MHTVRKDNVAAELCIYMLNNVSLSSHYTPFVSLWVCGYKRKCVWRGREKSSARAERRLFHLCVDFLLFLFIILAVGHR